MQRMETCSSTQYKINLNEDDFEVPEPQLRNNKESKAAKKVKQQKESLKAKKQSRWY